MTKDPELNAPSDEMMAKYCSPILQALAAGYWPAIKAARAQADPSLQHRRNERARWPKIGAAHAAKCLAFDRGQDGSVGISRHTKRQ